MTIQELREKSEKVFESIRLLRGAGYNENDPVIRRLVEEYENICDEIWAKYKPIAK